MLEKESDMKKGPWYASALLLAALLCLGGCGDRETPTDTTADTAPESKPLSETLSEVPSDTADETADETPGETSAPETVPDTEPETTRSDVRLDALLLRFHEDSLTLDYAVSGVPASVQDVSVELVLSDAEGEIAREVSHTREAESATLSCPAARLGGELTLTVRASLEGEVVDELWLKSKNRLPQLTPDGARCVVAAMTDEEKASLVVGNYAVGAQGISGGTVAIERLGVPATLCMDGPAGVRYNESVWYPAVINVSSSWDTELALRVGVALGEDTLAHGFDIVLAPGINIQKNVLGGRNFEYASEDPILSGLMIASYVNGIQSTGAGTSLKHFAANNQETARGGVSANLTERALREIYLKGFGIVIKDAQPMTVMSSYNRINGTHTAASRDLLTDILRGEFGFEGMVFSDWGAQGSMAEKVTAGNDVNMPGDDGDAEAVLAALSSGAISETDLNACCYRILRTVTRSAAFLGVEKNTQVDYRGNGAVSTDAATEGMVLLQNRDATLPLAEDCRVALFGNGSTATVYGGAGSGGVNARQTTSILSGIDKYDGLTLVNKTDNPFLGCAAHDPNDLSKDVEVTVAYAEEMAEAADVAVIVISRGSSEGADRTARKGDFLLGDTERIMLDRVSTAFRAKGKRVVVLLNTGSPIEVASWQALADAILWIGYPGQGAGTAVARVLSGEVNPSGKTTLTWCLNYASTPAGTHFPGSSTDTVYYEDIYVGYRYYETFDVAVSYPFGYGLSYTTFAYRDFKLEENGDGTVTATVTVQNTGKVAGREVVQLYVTKPETHREQAALELCGFRKTALLEPGASETVRICVRTEALMTYDTEESRWVMDDGTYTYRVGPSSAGPHSTATVTLDATVVVQDVENRCTPHKTFDYIQKDTYEVPDLSVTRENLLLGKPVTSNYDESGELVAAFAVDGDYITRWSGLGLSSGAYHTLEIDLGAEYAIGEFNIIWEAVRAPFTVLYSTDGKTYTEHGTYLDDGTQRSFLNLWGAKARYVRVQIERNGQYVSIFELEAYEATEADIEAGKDQETSVPKTNLAIGKPVTASGTEGGYVASNAVDGSISTRWGSDPNGEGWILVDLETVLDITRIRVTLESAWVPYTVEYSTDGERYTKLCDKPKDTLLVDEMSLSVSARYIRVRRDGSNWFSIYEIEVYGA